MVGTRSDEPLNGERGTEGRGRAYVASLSTSLSGVVNCPARTPDIATSRFQVEPQRDAAWSMQPNEPQESLQARHVPRVFLP